MNTLCTQLSIALLLLLSLIFGNTAIYAHASEPMLTDGMTWRSVGRTTAFPPGDDRAISFTTEWLTESTEIAGHVCYKLMASTECAGVVSDPQCFTYVYEQSGRVYYYDSSLEVWKLMYDFNLQPGDTAEVWWFNGTYAYDNMTSYSKVVVCDEITTDCLWPSVSLMQLSCYPDKESACDPEYEPTHGQWLAGIGSEAGFMENCSFELQGFDSTLVEVVANGVTIYSNHQEADAAIRIEDNSDMRDLQVYTLDGIPLPLNQPITMETLPSGIYIVATQGKRRTIIIR